MKPNILILATLAVLLGPSALSQDEAPAPRETFTYYLPFVESTFSGDWTFRLEMTTLGTEPFAVKITGMGHQGSPLFETTTEYAPHEIVTWRSDADQSKQRLQSLIVTSDSELSGILWMENSTAGFVNAVSMVLDGNADRLVMPHIPNDRYSWKTTAAVVGVDAGQTSGALQFAYLNEDGIERSLSLRSSLGDGVWYAGSPYHKIPIGSAELEETALWGSFYTESETFHLAGVQSFALLSDEAPLSCALELVPGEGRTTAMVGLSREKELGYNDWLAFTNPNDEPVRLELNLTYLPDEPADPEPGDGAGDEEESGPLTQTAVETIVLPPLARSVHILFDHVFADIEGTPYILRYSATAEQVETTEGTDDTEAEPVPLPIYAIHLQADGEIERLGSNHFTDKVGRFGQAWLNPDGPETQIDIYNPGELTTFISLTLTDHLGNELLFAERIEIEPGAAHFGFGSEAVATFLEETGHGIDFDASLPIRVTIALQRGDGIFTKLTAKARDEKGDVTDIAIVDGAVITPATENPPF